MCGITGIFSFDSSATVDPVVLTAMRDALVHRGPDGAGMEIDGNVGLAHRRLSIIDLAHGQQPMLSPDSNVCLSYNGEIYNYRELRTELEGLGHRFRTQSDTEVVLSSYLQWGLDALERFNGMFALAIWDSRSRKLHLVRDRMGIKPLYWAKVGENFIFASEIKSLLRFPGISLETDLDAISSYLTFRQAVWDISFYKNINKVLPGNIVSVDVSGINVKAYWTLPIANPDTQLSEYQCRERAEELLSKAVERRMVADVPVGAYLSGGLDSGVVVAMMTEHVNDPVNTFSIGYEEAQYDEGKYAEIVAKQYQTNHNHYLMPREDFESVWRELIRHKDMPLSIPHEIALYRLSVELKKQVTVALSGEGADELFSGYGRVQRSAMDWKKAAFTQKIFGPVLSARLANLGVAAGTGFDHARFGSHMEQFFHVYNWVPFDEKLSLFSGDVRRELDGDKRTIDVFRSIFDQHSDKDPYDTVLHIFEKIHLGCLLDRLDCMSMAASVEARVPFVDHELIEFVTHIPRQFKMKWNSALSKTRAVFNDSFSASEWLDTNKHILRQIGDDVLPQSISRRKKLGFPTPLDAWMKDGMKDLARDLLLDETTRQRGIFDVPKLEKMMRSTEDLPYDFYGKKIWMLMNIELWFREVVDRAHEHQKITSSIIHSPIESRMSASTC